MVGNTAGRSTWPNVKCFSTTWKLLFLVAGPPSAAFGRKVPTGARKISGTTYAALLGSNTSHNRYESLISLRSEEHTSELQSHSDLVCRLLLEKKKNKHPSPRLCDL